MEQLEAIAIIQVDANPDQEPLAEIGLPVQSMGRPAYWTCAVLCPTALSGPKEIAGVDARQAMGLATRFAIRLLETQGYETEELQPVPMKSGTP